MRACYICVAALLAASPLGAADLPSGQEAVLHEVLVDAQPDESFLRFRFLTPQIGPGPQKLDFETASADMLHLCETVALPYMAEFALSGDWIVISFMDRITEFGLPDPDAVQYFEQFRPVDNACIWEEF